MIYNRLQIYRPAEQGEMKITQNVLVFFLKANKTGDANSHFAKFGCQCLHDERDTECS